MRGRKGDQSRKDMLGWRFALEKSRGTELRPNDITVELQDPREAL
jgi:hypothetical protein